MKKATGGMSVSVQKRVRISEATSRKGNTDAGPHLSDLNTEDKSKISKLVERVVALGQENDSLVRQLQEVKQRREEDVMVAIGIIRSELQQKHDEVTDLQAKRLGALELLHKYQNKISELSDSLRAYQRGDTEKKAQLAGYKTELNNLQQLLETQSQTIQSYRMQVSSAASKSSGTMELEEALRKRTNDLRFAENRATELEGGMQGMQEQISSLRAVIHEKDKQIVDLNEVLMKYITNSGYGSTIKDTQFGSGGSGQKEVLSMDRDAASSQPTVTHSVSSGWIRPKISNWSISSQDNLRADSSTAYNSINQTQQENNGQLKDASTNWGESLKDEDFISHLERLAKEKKERKEHVDGRHSVSSPPPRAHPPPPTRMQQEDVESFHNEMDEEMDEEPPYVFDDSYSSIRDHITDPSPISNMNPSRIKRSISPPGGTNSRKGVKVQPAAGGGGGLPVRESARRGKVSSLSSSASTLINTVSKGNSSQHVTRSSYSAAESSRARHDEGSEGSSGAGKRIKFGVRVSKGGADHRDNDVPAPMVREERKNQSKLNMYKPNNKAVSKRTTGSNKDTRAGSSASKSMSMYDPILFDLVDEMDSHDASTISSISRHYDGNHW